MWTETEEEKGVATPPTYTPTGGWVVIHGSSMGQRGMEGNAHSQHGIGSIHIQWESTVWEEERRRGGESGGQCIGGPFG